MASLSTFAVAAGILGTAIALSAADAAQMASAPIDLTFLSGSGHSELILIGKKSGTVSKSTSTSSSRSTSCSNGTCTTDSDSKSDSGTNSSTSTSTSTSSSSSKNTNSN